MVNPQAPIGNSQTEKSYSDEEFIAWLVDSCERQHVAVTITNPGVLADIATLLRTA